ASPAQAGLPIRIEAAALEGRPVHFAIKYPWQSGPEAVTEDPRFWAAARQVGLALFAVTFLIGSALVARRNLRQGRGHRTGALRLAAFTFIVRLLTWLFGAPHVSGPEEMNLFLGNLAYALYDSAQLWVLYLALEPALRRLWPDGIVSWVRALDGRLLDPLVGRDVLIGTLLGVLSPPGGRVRASLLFIVLAIMIGLVALLRFGVLTWVVCCFFAILLLSFPLTADLSSWNAAGTLLVAVVLAAAAIY